MGFDRSGNGKRRWRKEPILYSTAAIKIFSLNSG
jgi:hypothetical protein